MSVRIEKADRRDLPIFAEMEQEPDTREFITPYTLEKHIEKFSSPEIVYLRILSGEQVVGFFLLALDSDGVSVEFRRVVIKNKGRGIGQIAITRMEEFCRLNLDRTRIWLDVLEQNTRGRHVYEKLGYRKFDSGFLDEKPLLLYERIL